MFDMSKKTVVMRLLYLPITPINIMCKFEIALLIWFQFNYNIQKIFFVDNLIIAKWNKMYRTYLSSVDIHRYIDLFEYNLDLFMVVSFETILHQNHKIEKLFPKIL